jgi:hypothetical protein
MRAQVNATADPNVFKYVFHGLKITELYTVDVRLPGGACPKVTWVGPRRGVFSPAAQGSLDLAGYALTTRIDVQSLDAAGNEVFRASDSLVEGVSEVRRFRWTSDLADAAAHELQIATSKFRPDLETPANCGSPSGLIWRQALSGATGSNFTAAVDFGSLIQNEGPGDGVIGTGDSTGVGLGGSGTGDGTLPPVSEAMRAAILNGAPLYVRIIPRAADGQPLCNRLRSGVPANSVLSYYKFSNFVSTLQSSPSLITSGRYQPAQAPTTHDFCVTATRVHLAPLTLEFDNNLQLKDQWGYLFRQAGQIDANGVILPGMFICGDNSSSVFDDVGDFFSGFVDAIASAVSFIADLYNDIKAEVVAFVGSALDAVGLPCEEDSFCRDALDTALSTALAAVGLPPSLPNFDALVDEGLDYVAGYVAARTGLPKEGVGEVIGIFANEARAAQGGGGGLPDWLTYDNRFRPAVLALEVTTNPLAPLAPIPTTFFRVGSAPGGVYLPATVPLEQGQSNFKVALTLRPDLTGTADLCMYFPLGGCPADLALKLKLSDWYGNRYAGKCTALTLNAVRGYFPFESTEKLYTHTLRNEVPGNLPSIDSDSCQ